jgi:glucan-binding YG repeat protein
MSSDVVMIANKSYTIKQSMSDRIRRRKYFLMYNGTAPSSASATLTEEENQLLNDLGIDSKMITSLKFYLATFFDNLYMCSNDSSIILRKDCNIPYYVLWSIMFANKEATDKRIRENKEAQFVSRNIDVAMTNAMLHNMEAVPITNEVDKLFQLVLTSTPAIQTSDIFSNNLFALPSDEKKANGESKDKPKDELKEDELKEDELKEDERNDQRRENQLNDREEEDITIKQIFTLLLTQTAPSESVAASDPIEQNSVSSEPSSELAHELLELYTHRTSTPVYTFSQHDTTCTTDTLFTILLQADLLGAIFVNNAAQILKSKTYNTSFNPYYALQFMLQRYINMLKLEQSHIESQEPISKRRLSINKSATTQFGKQALAKIKESQGDYCVGATRSIIMNYLSALKQKLLTDGLISETQLNFTLGNNFKSMNLINWNNIKGIFIGHPIDNKTGHATGFVKINGNWYFSNNEVGLLHPINDPVFISLILYKLYHSTDDEPIFQMEYTETNKQTAPNLSYRFKVALDTNSFYYYPDATIDPFEGLQVKSPHVTPARIIIITSSDSSKDNAMEITQELLKSPTANEFIGQIKTKLILNELNRAGL